MESQIVREVGPYRGNRIAHTSDDVVEVILRRIYYYEGHVISVNNIPARHDKATGRIFVSGPLALRINRQVERIMETIRQQSAMPKSPVQRVLSATPYSVSIDAATFKAA